MGKNREHIYEVVVELTDSLIEKMEDLHRLIEKCQEIRLKEGEGERLEYMRLLKGQKEAERVLRELSYNMMYSLTFKATEFKGVKKVLGLAIMERAE